jgi:alkylation response protein AidB-like acyl-CoA dehydrogenase
VEFSFSFEELEIRRSVGKLVGNDLLPRRREIEDLHAVPDDLWAKIKDLQLLKSAFAEPYGLGGTFTGLVVGLEAMAYATMLPPWLVFENFVLARALDRHGSNHLKQQYLPGLLGLTSIGALAFTEADTGTDVAQLKTVARPVDGGFLINGAKRFITNSSICDSMVLFAKTDEKLTAFLVHSKNLGYVPGPRERYLCAPMAHDNGDVYFEDYFAPHDHVIGRVGDGFSVLLDAEAHGKIVFCALYAGLARRALDLSIDYALARTHRGTPIGKKFQMIQVKLARMKVRVEAMQAYLWQTCAKVDRGEDITADAAALKILVGEDVTKITAEAMEVYGAYGISEDYDVARLYRTAISAQVVMGGVLDVQRVIVARSLLGQRH